VVIFICNHCPYVIHINPRLVNIATKYKSKGVNVIAISSNDVQHYPQDGPKQMKLTAEENHYSFPYLYDDTQEVARAFDAACTPDLFVYDHELKLVYRGQFDDSRPSNTLPVTGKDLCCALDALIEGRAVSTNQIASIGCNIKWKRG
jgi:thiol-disulfide isomerase/thioredoxin